MGNLTGFDANNYEPAGRPGTIPAGEYEVAIVASEVKPTKKGDGKLLVLELEVVAGRYQGRKLWDRLNIHNPNPDAQQIARGTLSAICRAVGVLTPGDSTALHDRPLLANVGIELDPQYGEKNKIKAYLPRKGMTESLRTPASDAGISDQPLAYTKVPEDEAMPF